VAAGLFSTWTSELEYHLQPCMCESDSMSSRPWLSPAEQAADDTAATCTEENLALGFDFSWSVGDLPAAGAPASASGQLSQAAEELVLLLRQSIELKVPQSVSLFSLIQLCNIALLHMPVDTELQARQLHLGASYPASVLFIAWPMHGCNLAQSPCSHCRG
jgi:hypothetical protein